MFFIIEENTEIKLTLKVKNVKIIKARITTPITTAAAHATTDFIFFTYWHLLKTHLLPPVQSGKPSVKQPQKPDELSILMHR